MCKIGNKYLATCSLDVFVVCRYYVRLESKYYRQNIALTTFFVLFFASFNRLVLI